jgi:hypothetical protein
MIDSLVFFLNQVMTMGSYFQQLLTGVFKYSMNLYCDQILFISITIPLPMLIMLCLRSHPQKYYYLSWFVHYLK